jgi:hypothetical protein
MKKHLLTLMSGLLLAGTLSAGAQVFVRIGPPPPPVREVVPPPPHPGWIWQGGYHRWDGARYVWVPGAYVAPPRPGVRWIPGHWRNTPRGYIWVEGHWR